MEVLTAQRPYTELPDVESHVPQYRTKKNNSLWARLRVERICC